MPEDPAPLLRSKRHTPGSLLNFAFAACRHDSLLGRLAFYVECTRTLLLSMGLHSQRAQRFTALSQTESPQCKGSRAWCVPCPTMKGLGLFGKVSCVGQNSRVMDVSLLLVLLVFQGLGERSKGTKWDSLKRRTPLIYTWAWVKI